jgi:hypothetical protein
MKIKSLLLLVLLLEIEAHSQALYEMPAKVDSRLSSFENPNGEKGKGAQTNKGAKGNAWEWIMPGESKSLLDVKGEGTIQRIWLTIDQNPTKLRSLRLQMFWDGATKPAVDVPMGDFFLYNLGKQVPFENALFSSGEGRSFNCYVPMPFRKAARILLINEGIEQVKLFYDVDFSFQPVPASALYFHAYWSRTNDAKLGHDIELLPKTAGKGRFLGMSAAVITDSTYSKSWWGEGEIKMFIDGDTKHPTIAGTGLEDYLGSAWGLGKFINQYQGCTFANDSLRQFSFYRFHIPDPIYFNKEIRVTLQQVGGWMKNEVRDLYNKGVKLQPISIDGPAGFVRLFDIPNAPKITDPTFPDGWINFFRVDDYAIVSYFYLNKTSSTLPALPAVSVRTGGVN